MRVFLDTNVILDILTGLDLLYQEPLDELVNQPQHQALIRDALLGRLPLDATSRPSGGN